jgi:hypothetical protein
MPQFSLSNAPPQRGTHVQTGMIFYHRYTDWRDTEQKRYEIGLGEITIRGSGSGISQM